MTSQAIDPTSGNLVITVPDDAPEAPRVNRADPIPRIPDTSQATMTAGGSSPAEPEAAPQTNYTPPSDPTPAEDIERLLPKPGEPFALESGTMVIANPLKLRGFLAMLKIVTRGASIALGEVRLNASDEDFMQSMMALFLFAIPEAEDEAVDFIRIMVKPAGPFEDADAMAKAEVALTEEMDDPDLEDVFTIIEVVIRNEGADLRRLGKRLMSAMEFAQKTNALNS